PNTDSAASIAVDNAGNAYVTGTTASTNFPTTVGAFQPDAHITVPANNEGFVTKLNPDGSALIYSTYLGGSAGELLASIAIDSEGNAWVAGGTGSTNFPVTVDAYQSTLSPAVGSAFATKLGNAGALAYSSY